MIHYYRKIFSLIVLAHRQQIIMKSKLLFGECSAISDLKKEIKLAQTSKYKVFELYICPFKYFSDTPVEEEDEMLDMYKHLKPNLILNLQSNLKLYSRV